MFARRSSAFTLQESSSDEKPKKKETIKMKSYEYGAKETKSCGSGATASFFLLYMLNKVSNKVSIIQPGGKVTCFTNNNKYYLQGTVNLLFKGELIYEF